MLSEWKYFGCTGPERGKGRGRVLELAITELFQRVTKFLCFGMFCFVFIAGKNKKC